jgi:membrane fusion protein (multidrug efflux system)
VASRSLQREGAYVNSVSENAKLTYVAALDPIWVNFSVSQNQLAKARKDAEAGRLVPPQNQEYEVDLILPDGTPFPEKGRISFADPSFSPDTGSFLVRAVLPNPKHDLRPGMFVTAYLRGSMRPEAIVVPQLAVQRGSNGHLVYVIKPDGTAEVRPVIVGDYYGKSDIVIVNGLRAGDQVVVEGVLKVVPGQSVKIVEPGQAEAKGGGAAKAPEKNAGAKK